MRRGDICFSCFFVGTGLVLGCILRVGVSSISYWRDLIRFHLHTVLIKGLFGSAIYELWMKCCYELVWKS